MKIVFGMKAHPQRAFQVDDDITYDDFPYSLTLARGMFDFRKHHSEASPADNDWSAEVADLYRTYSNWVVAFLARRFGREIAEDLAQETFLRLAQHPIDWRSPKALLARIALNAAQDHLRREKAQKRPRLVGTDDVPEGITLPDQHETLLHREVVAKLPRNLRDVYVLSRFGGLTYADIAMHLGISVKTVEKRMTQALKLCVARYRG